MAFSPFARHLGEKAPRAVSYFPLSADRAQSLRANARSGWRCHGASPWGPEMNPAAATNARSLSMGKGPSSRPPTTCSVVGALRTSFRTTCPETESAEVANGLSGHDLGHHVRNNHAVHSAPEFRQETGRVVQVVWRPTVQVAVQVTDQVQALRNSLFQELSAALGIPTDQVTDQVARMLRQTVSTPASTEELMAAAGLAHRPHFRTQYLVPIMQGGWLVRTHPQPNHPRQRYKLTPQGQAWLDRFNTLPKP